MSQQSTITITNEQVDFFREEGYLAVERITTDEEMERMRAAYDDIFARRAGREEGHEYDLAGPDEEGTEPALPQILEPRKYADELRDTLYEADLPPYNVPSPKVRIWDAERGPYGQETVYR